MSKQVLRMKYHPAKKEVEFFRYQSGNEIEISSTSQLRTYMNERGKFILQDHGNKFFEDIAKVFDGEISIHIEVVTTKTDYEDFLQMLEYYNTTGGVKITATLLSELPDMTETYHMVKEHGETAISILNQHKSKFWNLPLENEKVKKCVEGFTAEVQKEADNIREKINSMSNNYINLCFAGVYSAGKSALINAILGYQILPEAINSETARMFCIQSPKAGEVVRITFCILAEFAELLWNEKTGTFDFGAAPVENSTRKEIQEAINAKCTEPQHRQIYYILKTLNAKNDIGPEIQVYFPIQLNNDTVQFRIYDTPGTDSNVAEHQAVLQDALSEQTHSILIFVAAPNKTEGAGNDALLKYLKKAEEKSTKVSIDIGRSLFVINWADTIGPDERIALQNIKIKYKADDEDEDSFSIQLADKKLFFTSAKVAYAAQAHRNGIATKNEEFIIKQQCGTISDKEFGRYYRQNRIATSERATKRLIEYCDCALEKAENENQIDDVLYICSGLFALETEIMGYAEKYASAVRAFAIIDSVDKALSAMDRNARSIESKNQEDIQKINHEIEELRTTIANSVQTAYAKYELPKNEALPKNLLKKLHLNSDYLADHVQDKAVSFIDRLLQGWLFGLGKVIYKKSYEEEITQKIISILSDYTNDFLEKRQRSLEETRDAFTQDIKEAIRKNGYISEAAKRFVLEVRPPEIKKHTDGAEFRKIFDTQKCTDTFLWIDTVYIDKSGLKEAVNRKLMEITTSMTNDFTKDYRTTLTSVLNAITAEFTQNIEKYSLLMQAKLEDKKTMEQLGGKIAAMADDIRRCQEELDKKIWSAKEHE